MVINRINRLLCFAIFSLFLSGYAQDIKNTDFNKYDKLIFNAAKKHRIHPCLVKAVIWRESRFDKYAVGKAGEVGVMQITEAAVADWAKAQNCPIPKKQILFYPPLNIEIGTWYLARAEKYWRKYPESYTLALCEYNAGRKGMLAKVRIQRCGKVGISNTKLFNYAHSIITQYYSYLKKYKKRKLLKNLAYECN